MVLCSSQQVVVALMAVLVSVVVLPRMLGVGSGPPDKEPRGFDPRHHRRGRLHMDTARHANTLGTQVLIRIPKYYTKYCSCVGQSSRKPVYNYLYLSYCQISLHIW